MFTPAIPIVMTVLIIICLGAAIWLLLHLTALTALFRGNADLVASPKRPRASRSAVIVALALFCGSLIAILATQTLAIVG